MIDQLLEYFNIIKSYDNILTKIKPKVVFELTRHHVEKGNSWATMENGLEEMEDNLWGIVKDLNPLDPNYKNELIDIIALCSLMYERKEIEENN